MSELREVESADLDVFYEQQRDPEATRMALFPAREREAFDAHWRRVLADEAVVARAIVHHGAVAGNVLCWEAEGRRYVGYWLGREFWGKGVATRALAQLLEEVTARPLYAWVAATNVGSVRVLEKCGFVPVDSRAELDERLGDVVEELLYELS
jgi:RimJ/RimL family protein N-acetyltransferase